MNNYYFTKIISVLMIICSTMNMFSQDAQSEKINTFLDQWHKDAADVNMKAYFDKISDDGIYIGTDATEVWTKQEFYDWSKPHFEKGETWNFKTTARNIYFNEDESVAWFDEKLKASYGELRGSGVLKFENGLWKIYHYVLSLPVPNDKFRKIIEVIDNR